MIVQKMHAPASTVDTTGLPNPPVVAVDTALVATVPTWTTPETLPPAIMDIPHCIIGLESESVEDIIKTPANTAAGEAIVSKRLSIQGT